MRVGMEEFVYWWQLAIKLGVMGEIVYMSFSGNASDLEVSDFQATPCRHHLEQIFSFFQHLASIANRASASSKACSKLTFTDARNVGLESWSGEARWKQEEALNDSCDLTNCDIVWVIALRTALKVLVRRELILLTAPSSNAGPGTSVTTTHAIGCLETNWRARQSGGARRKPLFSRSRPKVQDGGGGIFRNHLPSAFSALRELNGDSLENLQKEIPGTRGRALEYMALCFRCLPFFLSCSWWR